VTKGVNGLTDLWLGDKLFRGIEALVFDKDGTLADSWGFLTHLARSRAQYLDAQVPRTGAKLLRAFGWVDDTLSLEGLMAVGTRQDNLIAAATYVAETGESWGNALAIARGAFQTADQILMPKAPHTPPLPGIGAMLQSLHTSGLKLAVLSGDTTANVEAFVHHYQFDSWINWCAGSDRGLAKPDPALLAQACQHLGVAVNHVLVIGDSILDAQMAIYSAGFISVTWGGSPGLATADVILTHPHQIQVIDAPRIESAESLM
jgi:phosphoglycolate phosphatase